MLGRKPGAFGAYTTPASSCTPLCPPLGTPQRTCHGRLPPNAAPAGAAETAAAATPLPPLPEAIARVAAGLPIAAVLPDVLHLLDESPALVLQASTGL